MKTYHARVERGEVKYWAVWVEEIQRATQARHLRELDAMTRDLIEIMDPEAGDFVVEYEYVLPDEAARHIQAREMLRAQMERLQEAASAENAAAAAALTDLGIPARDAGQLLGVSHQRISQLVKQATARPPAATPFTAVSMMAAQSAAAEAFVEFAGRAAELVKADHGHFVDDYVAAKQPNDGELIPGSRDEALVATRARH